MLWTRKYYEHNYSEHITWWNFTRSA